ncbi:MAG: hypothetical protein JSV66_17960 [Trueperaceae bacterium]|nr:MAG: hypothetical protein JSV66_17960 [Trueperaceae bacterium]
MDAAELFGEFQDRHIAHLVYEGPYRLHRRAEAQQDLFTLLRFFEDWRQRIYRFENRLGASAVLYQPLHQARMRWDLIITEVLGEEPFAFRYADSVKRNLKWDDVQSILDGIKER